MKLDKIEFKKGMYKLNSEPNFDYQLNRVIMWGDGNLKDIKEIAGDHCNMGNSKLTLDIIMNWIEFIKNK